MKISKIQAMIIQAVIEAAILRVLRKMEGKSEEELKAMLEKEKNRNKRLIAGIEGH